MSEDKVGLEDHVLCRRGKNNIRGEILRGTPPKKKPNKDRAAYCCLKCVGGLQTFPVRGGME